MPAAGDLPGRIVIRGLRCRGRQGTTPIEQQQAHDYLVDVSLSVDIAEAVERDNLAAALDINQKEQDAGFAPVTLISADQALSDAATAEGLTVDDPRSHP